MATRTTARIERIDVSAYTIPTDRPESDGTLAWDFTTLVLVEVTAGSRRGLGYTYADATTAELVKRELAPLLDGHDALGAQQVLGLVAEDEPLQRPREQQEAERAAAVGRRRRGHAV